METINKNDIAKTLLKVHNLWAAYKLGLIGQDWDALQVEGFKVEFQTCELGLTGITPLEAVHRGRAFCEKYEALARIG